MPLDYNIPLLAQPFDAQGTFDNALLNGQNLNTMRNMPLNNELLKQKVNAGRYGAMDDEMKSIYQGAQVLKKYTDSKDLKGATNFLMQRKADLQRQGLNTEDTDYALKLAQSGDLTGLSNAVSDAITLGDQLLGEASRAQFSGTDLFQDGNGNLFYGTQAKDPRSASAKTVFSAVGGSGQPVGPLMPVNSIGLTASQIPQQKAQEKAAETGADLSTRLTIEPALSGANAGAAAQAKAGVEAKTAPTIAADVTLNTERAKATEEQRAKFIQAGITAKQSIPKTERLIALNKAISGGKVEVWKKFVTDITGSTNPNIGEFQNIARGMVLDNLKAMLGGNPTEGERAFLLETQANIGAGQEVNDVVLRNMLSVQKAQVARAQKLTRDKNLTVEDLLLNESDAPLEKSGATRSGIPFTVRQVK